MTSTSRCCPWSRSQTGKETCHLTRSMLKTSKARFNRIRRTTAWSSISRGHASKSPIFRKMKTCNVVKIMIMNKIFKWNHSTSPAKYKRWRKWKSSRRSMRSSNHRASSTAKSLRTATRLYNRKSWSTAPASSAAST